MGASDRQADPDSTMTFGPFTLDLGRAALTCAGAPIPLRPKTLALLSYFAAHPGRVLEKQELLAAVWPGVVVTDDSLSQCVRELRTAMGEKAQGLIRTVPRRGYIFEGDSKVRVDEGIKVRRSIAVLPFVEHGAGPDGYFAESVAEDLVTELSRLPDTLVITRASAAVVAARESDVRIIGRELGVRYLLLGNVRRDGAAVQINARFVSAGDGVVLWAEQFSYRDAGEWDWRRDIALRVARVLDVRLSAVARQPVRSGRHVDAIDAVLEGQHLIRHLGGREDILRARALFEAALTVEPESASALTGWAHSHLAELEFYRTGDAQAQALQAALAEQAIAKALAVDPEYPYAYCLRGHLLHERGDYDGALAVYQRYLEAYPSEAWAHARIGTMKLLLGRLDDVAAHMAAALKLSPLEHGLISYTQVRAGWADFQLGRDDAAYQRFREAAAVRPGAAVPRLAMAAIDALDGRQAEAAAHLEQARRLQPDQTLAGWLEQIRHLLGGPAATERLAEGLRRAGLSQ